MMLRPSLDSPARRIAPLVVLVVAMHGALLAIPVRSARPHGSDVAHAPVQVRALELRHLAASPAAAPVSVDAEPWRLSLGPALPQELVEVASPPVPMAPELTAAAAPPAMAEVSPPLEAIHFVSAGSDNDADYFPRAMLSVAPAPVDLIVIDYPLLPSDTGYHTSELALFIDENGHVARVRVVGKPLPPVLEDAARAAFLQARFRAGESAGKAVKSQIRVEVVFDDRPPSRS